MLKTWTVLYRAQDSLPLDPPEAFVCQAEDMEHAEEQCMDAYDLHEDDIVWVYDDEPQRAYEDYWNAGIEDSRY